MALLISILILLLYIAIAACVVKLVLWVLSFAGLPIPDKIIWAIFALIVAIMVLMWLTNRLPIAGVV